MQQERGVKKHNLTSLISIPAPNKVLLPFVCNLVHPWKMMSRKKNSRPTTVSHISTSQKAAQPATFIRERKKERNELWKNRQIAEVFPFPVTELLATAWVLLVIRKCLTTHFIIQQLHFHGTMSNIQVKKLMESYRAFPFSYNAGHIKRGYIDKKK